MKKLYFLFCVLAVLAISPLHAQDINFDANEFEWIDEGGEGMGGNGLGFMNVSELPGNGGAFVFGSGWAVPDLISLVNTSANTTTLLPNRVNDSDPFWQTGNLDGNKIMDANHFIADDNLLGGTFTFNGNVQSNTLNNSGFTSSNDFTVTAFIKVFNVDFSAVLASDTVDLRTTSGDFTLTMDTSDTVTFPPDSHIQYGFQFIGPNINNDASFDAAYANLGSIVVGPNTTLSTNDVSLSEFKIFPNPTQNNWTISSTQQISKIQVYDILGKNVLNMNPELGEVTIDASVLNNGLYFAKIHTANGVNSVKLIKK